MTASTLFGRDLANSTDAEAGSTISRLMLVGEGAAGIDTARARHSSCDSARHGPRYRTRHRAREAMRVLRHLEDSGNPDPSRRCLQLPLGGPARRPRVESFHLVEELSCGEPLPEVPAALHVRGSQQACIISIATPIKDSLRSSQPGLLQLVDGIQPPAGGIRHVLSARLHLLCRPCRSDEQCRGQHQSLEVRRVEHLGEGSQVDGQAGHSSDIPVYREQAPPLGVFFNPDDPSALADLLVASAETTIRRAMVTSRQMQLDCCSRGASILCRPISGSSTRTRSSARFTSRPGLGPQIRVGSLCSLTGLRCAGNGFSASAADGEYHRVGSHRHAAGAAIGAEGRRHLSSPPLRSPPARPPMQLLQVESCQLQFRFALSDRAT